MKWPLYSNLWEFGLARLLAAAEVGNAIVYIVAYLDTVELSFLYTPKGIRTQFELVHERRIRIEPCRDKVGHLRGYPVIAHQPSVRTLKLLDHLQRQHRGKLSRIDVAFELDGGRYPLQWVEQHCIMRWKRPGSSGGERVLFHSTDRMSEEKQPRYWCLHRSTIKGYRTGVHHARRTKVLLTPESFEGRDLDMEDLLDHFLRKWARRSTKPRSAKLGLPLARLLKPNLARIDSTSFVQNCRDRHSCRLVANYSISTVGGTAKQEGTTFVARNVWGSWCFDLEYVANKEPPQIIFGLKVGEHRDEIHWYYTASEQAQTLREAELERGSDRPSRRSRSNRAK